MTVDRKRKTGCEWCGNTTNNYDGVFSDLTDGTYCSDGCRDEAVRELQAECSHFTAVDIRIVEGQEYGRCEECDAGVVKEDEVWREA